MLTYEFRQNSTKPIEIKTGLSSSFSLETLILMNSIRREVAEKMGVNSSHKQVKVFTDSKGVRHNAYSNTFTSADGDEVKLGFLLGDDGSSKIQFIYSGSTSFFHKCVEHHKTLMGKHKCLKGMLKAL